MKYFYFAIKLSALLFFLLNLHFGFSQTQTTKIHIDSLKKTTLIAPHKKKVKKGLVTNNLHALKDYTFDQKKTYNPVEPQKINTEKLTRINFDFKQKKCLNENFRFPEKQLLPLAEWKPIADFSYKDNSVIDINHIEINHGLPSNYIRKVLFDEHDFLWIGTSAGGLLRYDGKNAQIFNTESGFPADRIYSMFKDSYGRFWVGTSNNGLICIDDNYFYSFGEDNGLVGTEIFSISEDKYKNIWVSTFGNGAYKLKFDDDKNLVSIENFTTQNGLLSNNITNIEHGKHGTIYFSSYGGGVSILNATIFHYLVPESGLSDKNIWRVYEDANADLWITTKDNGVVFFDHQSFYYLNTSNILWSNFSKDISEISPNEFYVPTYGGGFTYFLFDKQTKTLKYKNINTDFGLSDNRLHFVLPQQNGKLWIGSEGGLNQYNPNSFVSYNEKTGLLNKHVRRIMQDHHNFIWFVTVDGLSLFDGNRFVNYTTKQGLLSNNTRDIIQVTDNQFYLGTNNGLSFLTLTDNSEITETIDFTKKNGLPSEYIWALDKDTAGNIWAGTREIGVLLLQKTNENNYLVYTIDETNGLSGNMVWDIFVDHQQHIWVATEKGLTKIEPTADNEFIITNFNQKQGFSIVSPNYIFQDKNNRIWISGIGGLNLFFPKGLKTDSTILFQRIDKKDGLSHNQTQYITQDSSGTYWVGTEAGIDRMKVDFDDDNTITTIEVFQFSNKEGLKSHDAMSRSVLYDNQHRIWLGMGNDLTMLDLKKYKEQTNVPRLYLTHLKINNAAINFRELIKEPNDSIVFQGVDEFWNVPTGLELRYNQNNLSFGFAGIEWNYNAKLKIEYRINKINSKWQSLNESRVVVYQNIAAGKYVLQYRGVSGFGVHSPTYEYAFKILPPWWKTNLAYFVYMVSLIFIIYAIIQLYIGRLKHQKALLEITVDERTKEIATQKIEIEKQAAELLISNEKLKQLDKFKQSMTQMLVHDLKSPLNTIINSDDFKKIRHTGKQMLNLVWNILDVQNYEKAKMQLNTKPIHLTEVVAHAVEEVDFLASQKNNKIHVLFAADYTVMADFEILKRVFVNFLTNAIKYSQENKSIEIYEQPQQHELRIFVKDYGRGINKNDIPVIFDSYVKLANSDSHLLISTGLGLTFCKKALEAHGSSIQVESEVGKGATFSFALQLVAQSYAKKILVSENIDSKDFSISEIEYLLPFAEKLKTKKAYELTDVFLVLNKIDKQKSDSINQWVRELEESVLNSNAELYQHILNRIAR